MQLSSLQLRLIEDWQRDFPLVQRPYEAIGAALSASEEEVIASLRDLQERGALSRVGAAVRPNSAGASTLAAMTVPAHDVPRVAGIVNAEAGVNHNYEREHELNLWFVVTGSGRASVEGTVRKSAAHRAMTSWTFPWRGRTSSTSDFLWAAMLLIGKGTSASQCSHDR